MKNLKLLFFFLILSILMYHLLNQKENATNQIERKEEYLDDFKEIALKRIPVVLKNTSIKKWNLFKKPKKWDLNTFEQLAKKTLIGVDLREDGNENFLYFNEERELANSKIKWKAPFKILNMKTKDFVERLKNKNRKNEFLYHSNDIKYLFEKDFAKNYLNWTTIETMKIENETLESINFWIGKINTTATLHYDPSDNFFIQLSGRVSFLFSFHFYYFSFHFSFLLF
jgi:hypothetical protein